MKIITFRNKKDTDFIGLFVDQKEDHIVVDHPFLIQYNPMTGNIAMAPFCVFSDQSQFKFSLRELQFVVTVREPIAKHFAKMLKAVSEPDVSLDDSSDPPEDLSINNHLTSRSVH